MEQGKVVSGELVSVEQTRIRINYSVSAKGVFQPDITSEAETVETAMANLDKAKASLYAWAEGQGYKTEVIG